MNKREIARYIEYTKLEPTVTKEDIAKLCEDATKLGVYAICVNPKYVEFAKESLSDFSSKVKVVSVVGYPLGENAQEIKAMEAVLLKESGADEINVMLSTSAIITGNYDYVLEELKRIVDCTGIITKAIIDTSLLTEEQIIRTCEVCIEAGVKFIQTGTGHYAVIPETVKLISDAVAGICEVSAIGQISDIEKFYDIICAGATKIATKDAVDIIEGFNKKKD